MGQAPAGAQQIPVEHNLPSRPSVHQPTARQAGWKTAQFRYDRPKESATRASNFRLRREVSEKVSPLNRTDAELIEAHRRGDGSAAGVLVARHLARVRSLLFQLVLDRDEADELTQEVFVNVLRNLDGFRGEAAFATWLHRIAVNTARQAARRTRNRPLEQNGAVRDASGEVLAPEGELIRNEQRDRVQRALDKLSPPLRSAVVLTVMQGLSAGEAAEIEGCPVGTMYWRVHEARRLLRDELKGLIE